MEYKGKVAKIYKIIGGAMRVDLHHYYNKITGVETVDYITVEGLWVGNVLEWIEENRADTHEDMNVLLIKRNHLSHPIPLEPSEERYGLVDYLYTLLPNDKQHKH